MRVVGLVEHPDHVCSRYRLAALIPYLRLQKIDLELISLPGNVFARIALFAKLGGRAVILQRKLLSWLELKYLRSRASWLGFDFDDAVFLRDSYSPRGHHDSRRLGRFRNLMKQADCVFAGNGFLADQAAQNGAGKKVLVVPTSIEPNLYQPKICPATSVKLDRPIQMTWIGSSSTLQGLEKMAPLFNRIGTAIPGITLRVISDRFPAFSNLKVISIPWSGATEAAELAKGSVGISWIPNDPWSRGKCGLKVLQYMAAGLPVLANPVGVHPEMIRPGQEGFLPERDDEWVGYLERFNEDPGLCYSLGQNARLRAEKEYSVNNAARLVCQALSQSAGARQ